MYRCVRGTLCAFGTSVPLWGCGTLPVLQIRQDHDGRHGRPIKPVGYGFLRFSEEQDQQRALVEMQGVYCGNRPMRISTATPKTRSHQ
ncbi:hypothetical protein QBC38DRAFT_35496 [Podospora fimiseda]|uniref:RRM domain-containing protein n=1 Tax=Podospora fimiseda TaxID=252190 RepID=A0AAN7BII9_9PEZI|nr:hypothetical protein QBC38DRAFT_35496 [Podospora fimiseda]